MSNKMNNLLTYTYTVRTLYQLIAKQKKGETPWKQEQD